MPDSLKNRLLRHEVMPPDHVWESLSNRLDSEFNASDSNLSSRLDNVEIDAPPGSWEAIKTQLEQEVAPKKSTPVISTLFRRTAIAAAIAILLIAGSIYFLNNDGQNQATGGTTLSEVEPRVAIVPENNDSSGQLQKKTDTGASLPAADIISPPMENKNLRARRSAVDESSTLNTDPPVEVVDIEESHINTPTTVSALQPIAVSAPPIRDNDGNIIMDLALISKPGQQYITVTSPNGNPTKISAKFINCLRYMNGSANLFEYDSDAEECRTKFAEWRQRLLSQAEFMPSADNFFDLFELKDMIDE